MADTRACPELDFGVERKKELNAGVFWPFILTSIGKTVQDMEKRKTYSKSPYFYISYTAQSVRKKSLLTVHFFSKRTVSPFDIFLLTETLPKAVILEGPKIKI